jgi:hypothetical protein
VLIGTGLLGGSVGSVDPKTWRSRGRKKKRWRQMTDGQKQPRQSAIVKPKKPRNTML